MMVLVKSVLSKLVNNWIGVAYPPEYWLIDALTTCTKFFLSKQKSLNILIGKQFHIMKFAL